MNRIANSTHRRELSRSGAGRLGLAGVVCVLMASMLLFTASVRAQFGELVAFESPGDTTYYLDAETGDDENPGTRPSRAWKTLSQVNSTRFAAGDRLLIKAGTSYQGRLWPKGSGRPGVPIVIDKYGEGARPAIHAGGETSEALLLENTQGWHISNLELTNTGEKPEAFRFGLSITVEDMGSAGDFKLSNLYVHDVNGTTEPGLGEGAGIIWRSRGARVPTRFEGMLIENCTISDCGRNGILSLNDFADRTRWLANVGVVIRENDITSTQGDGIRLTGCVNAMVEYNRVSKAGGKEDGETGGAGGAGGIVLIGCDNSLVQYNEVWETAGAKNAALLCDTNSRDNTFQFNYTHDNAGPMAAVRSAAPNEKPGQPATDAGNVGTAVRYNISQNDGGALRLDGPTAGVRFHNNTIYTGADRETSAVVILNKPTPPTTPGFPGTPDSPNSPTGTILVNNLFYTLGSCTLDLSLVPDTQLHHNAYFGQHTRPEAEDGSITADPQLADPGQAQTLLDRLDGLDGYQTLPFSPLRSAGVRLKNHGNHDLWGNDVPKGHTVDIGAYQSFQGSSDKGGQPAQPAQEP